MPATKAVNLSEKEERLRAFILGATPHLVGRSPWEVNFIATRF